MFLLQKCLNFNLRQQPYFNSEGKQHTFTNKGSTSLFYCSFVSQARGNQDIILTLLKVYWSCGDSSGQVTGRTLLLAIEY